MAIDHIAVIGAGTMGNGIAHVCAQHRRSVTLIDLDEALLDRAVATIGRNLERQVKKERITPADREATLGRIQTHTDAGTGVAAADLVIEAVSEQKPLKAKLFGLIDEAAPEGALLASNTSSISITWLGAQTRRPQHVIGMHFFNPVPVMKLVEIVRGMETDAATYSAIETLARDLGKTPVTVQDYPGFISNRILMPMINEAVYCVMENVASVEDIDTVMQLGMAHPMGPLTLADFIGLDVCLSIMEVLHRELGDDKYRPCPLLRKMVTAGRLGRKTKQGFYPY